MFLHPIKNFLWSFFAISSNQYFCCSALFLVLLLRWKKGICIDWPDHENSVLSRECYGTYVESSLQRSLVTRGNCKFTKIKDSKSFDGFVANYNLAWFETRWSHCPCAFLGGGVLFYAFTKLKSKQNFFKTQFPNI